ncbi:pyridoxamine 5'-phosphate oxidase family protein [Pseudonocardia sp. CA-107938]|uniref:pyridoxamine 5'-phosphate oxidase family protein n=1 Tax=Pseudonocardia sp. CA-107938 TaxID=3240021 RepID=UPI003D8D8724
MPPRSGPERRANVLGALAHPVTDCWVATAGTDGPHLVPLTLAWLDERIVLAMAPSSRTARNLTDNGVARLGIGPTRDVAMIDAVVERSIDAAGELAERYAAVAGWDPRSHLNVLFVLRPERIQAWREVDEHPGRTLMRDGTWLV